MEAAALVAFDASYSYQSALAEVSKRFIEEKIVGKAADFKPLVGPGVVYGSVSANEVSSASDVSSVSSTALMLIGSNDSTALTERVAGKAVSISMCEEQAKNAGANAGAKQLTVCKEDQLAAWHGDYDKINWEAEMKSNPLLLKALGGGGSLGGSQVAIGS